MDDRLLQLVATNTDLSFLSVNSCHSVTDAGISSAVMASPNLNTVIIRDTSPTESYGHFLGKVLALQNLQKLELRSHMLDLQDPSPEVNPRLYGAACLFPLLYHACTPAVQPQTSPTGVVVQAAREQLARVCVCHTFGHFESRPSARSCPGQAPQRLGARVGVFRAPPARAHHDAGDPHGLFRKLHQTLRGAPMMLPAGDQLPS